MLKSFALILSLLLISHHVLSQTELLIKTNESGKVILKHCKVSPDVNGKSEIDGVVWDGTEKNYKITFDTLHYGVVKNLSFDSEFHMLYVSSYTYTDNNKMPKTVKDSSYFPLILNIHKIKSVTVSLVYNDKQVCITGEKSFIRNIWLRIFAPDK